MKLRIEYSRETNKSFSDNIPLYADWLEKKLAEKASLFVNAVQTNIMLNLIKTKQNIIVKNVKQN